MPASNRLELLLRPPEACSIMSLSAQKGTGVNMKILRKLEVVAKVGYCGEHIRRLEMAGEFPRRVALNPKGRAVGWLEHEINDWIAGRAAARDTAYQGAAS